MVRFAINFKSKVRNICAANFKNEIEFRYNFIPKNAILFQT